MATITPSAAIVEQSATQQFTQSGIGSPVWTLDGAGTLNQSGLYTAPGTSGAAMVCVHSPLWASVGAGCTNNADNSITISSASGYVYNETAAKVASVGDSATFTMSSISSVAYNLARSGQEYRFDSYYVYYNGAVISGYIGLPVGTKIRFDLIASGADTLVRIINVGDGSTVWTFTQPVAGALFFRWLIYTDNNIGVTLACPKFAGAGLTDYTQATATLTIQAPILLPRTNLELYCEPYLLSLSNGANVLSLTDQSAHLRHLTAASSYPTFQTNVVNGKSVVRFNGSQNPLKNTANFTVSCGWIVANFNGATFSDYKGLLSDLVNQTILVSNNSGTNFFDTQIEFFEFRSNDRIYPATDAPAPMNAFKLIFFRFWKPIVIVGIQLGQQTTFSARKWNGDVAFLALYSQNFHETEIRKYSKILADNFALTLADVYPYQADISDTPESINQSVNFYDPPEGDRISEVVGTAKRTIDLQFSVADQTEVKTMKSFHAAHYAAAVPFLYRDYRFTPPEDIEGYFDSQPDLDGANNNFNYGFKFKEK